MCNIAKCLWKGKQDLYSSMTEGNHAGVCSCFETSLAAPLSSNVTNDTDSVLSPSMVIFTTFTIFLIKRRKNRNPVYVFLGCGWLKHHPKETREGWPLLTIETEANGDSRTQGSLGPSLVGSCRYKICLSCLGCSSRTCTKYFFPLRTLFNFICLHRPVSWTGSRAGSPVLF